MGATDRGSIERPNECITVAILGGSDRGFGLYNRIDSSDLRIMSAASNPMSTLAAFTSISSLC